MKNGGDEVFSSNRGEEDITSSSSSDSSSDASLPRFLLLSDAFRDHLCRHPFPFVAAFLRENDDDDDFDDAKDDETKRRASSLPARNHRDGKETSDDDVGDKAGHVLAYDEQFLRRLDTLENRARRLRLFPNTPKTSTATTTTTTLMMSVLKNTLKGCALNEESSLEEENVFRGAFQTTLGASTSSLWASEEAFAKDGENGTIDFETRDDAKEDGEEEEETN